jgi:glycosyltransferase involved in cell wall biosynthesis
MKRIKVCHICGAIEGAPWMVEQLRELRDRFGYDVYAMVIREDCNFAERLRAAGIKCLYLEYIYKSLKEMVLLPLIILKMQRILRRERFDVVQTHLFPSMLVGRIASWLADTPVRLAMVASPFHLEAVISRYVDRATVWMETGVIASCEKTIDLYQQIGVTREKISLIYYGADERRFNAKEIQPSNIRAEFGWPSDTPVVSLVAYFYPKLPKSGWIPAIAFDRAAKGHEEFVEAARIVLRQMPNARFLMVGSGWEETGEQNRQAIIERVKSLGLEKEIIFTGYRSDVNGILRDVNVAVQAPIIENLGGTIEALMMQRPLVATRVGGIPDSVRDGETGILVEPANPEDLARGILQMLNSPEQAAEMARNGRRLMLERFSLRRTVDDLHELYQTQLESRTRHGYSLAVSAGRQTIALAVYAYLGFRVVLVEYIVRIYAPIYLSVFRHRIRIYLKVLLSRGLQCLYAVRRGLHFLFSKVVRAGYYARVSLASLLQTARLKIKRAKNQ